MRSPRPCRTRAVSAGEATARAGSRVALTLFILADGGLDVGQSRVPRLGRVALALLDIGDRVHELPAEGRAVRPDEKRLQAEQRVSVDGPDRRVGEERGLRRDELGVLVDRR